MKITMTVCDVCKDRDAETKQYQIREGDRRARVELCEAHGQPLEAYLAQSPTGKARRGSGSGTGARGGRSRVTTLDEIEAQKNK